MTKRQARGAAPTEGGVGGILKGLANLVEKLGDLAETGQELSKTAEFHGPGPPARKSEACTASPSRSASAVKG